MSEGSIARDKVEEYVIVTQDYQYEHKDQVISLQKGEILFLIKRTNADWWHVIRKGDQRPFYAPIDYIEQTYPQRDEMKQAIKNDTKKKEIQQTSDFHQQKWLKHRQRREAAKKTEQRLRSNGDHKMTEQQQQQHRHSSYHSLLPNTSELRERPHQVLEKLESTAQKSSHNNNNTNKNNNINNNELFAKDKRSYEGVSLSDKSIINKEIDHNKHKVEYNSKSKPPNLNLNLTKSSVTNSSDNELMRNVFTSVNYFNKLSPTSPDVSPDHSYIAKIDTNKNISDNIDSRSFGHNRVSSFKSQSPRTSDKAFPIKTNSGEQLFDSLYTTTKSFHSSENESSTHTSKSSLYDVSRCSSDSLSNVQYRPTIHHVVKAASFDGLITEERSVSSLEVGTPKARSIEELDRHRKNKDYVFQSNRLSYRNRSNSVDFKNFPKDFNLFECKQNFIDKGRKVRLSKDPSNRRKSWVDDGRSFDAALILDVPPKLPPKQRTIKPDQYSLSSSENITKKLQGPIDIALAAAAIDMKCTSSSTNVKRISMDFERAINHHNIFIQEDPPNTKNNTLPIALPRKINQSQLENNKYDQTLSDYYNSSSFDKLSKFDSNINDEFKDNFFENKLDNYNSDVYLSHSKDSDLNHHNSNCSLSHNKDSECYHYSKDNDLNHNNTDPNYSHSTNGEVSNIRLSTSTKSQVKTHKEIDRFSMVSHREISELSDGGKVIQQIPPSPNLPPRRLVFDDWGEYQDEATSRPYYYNSRTRDKRWKPPRKGVHSVAIPVVPVLSAKSDLERINSQRETEYLLSSMTQVNASSLPVCSPTSVLINQPRFSAVKVQQQIPNNRLTSPPSNIESPHTLPSNIPPPTHTLPSHIPPPTHTLPSNIPPPTHTLPSNIPPPTHTLPSNIPPPTHTLPSNIPPPTHTLPTNITPSTHTLPSNIAPSTITNEGGGSNTLPSYHSPFKNFSNVSSSQVVPRVPPSSAKPNYLLTTSASTSAISTMSSKFLEDDEDLTSDHQIEALHNILKVHQVPKGWIKKIDPSGQQIFFQSLVTGEKWYTSTNTSGKLYYYPDGGKDSQWTLPKHEEGRHGSTGSTESTARSPPQDYIMTNIKEDLLDLFAQAKMEGILSRTYYLKLGKKVRKNWTQSFVRYIPGSFSSGSTGLLLISKTKEDKKPEIFDLYPTCFLEIATDKKTSRYNVLSVRNGYDTEMLFQLDGEEKQRWIKVLSNHEGMKVSTQTDVDKRATKRLTEKEKTLARRENSSDSPASSDPTTIKFRLMNLIKRRPSQAVLEKKGIYKMEPVIGSTLKLLSSQDKTLIPLFVLLCIKNIEKFEENLKTDGLYRISGNAAQIQKIRFQVAQRNYNILEDEKDVHNLSGALKLFFRELKEPLVPYHNYDEFIEATASEFYKQDRRSLMLKNVIKKMPKENQETIKILLQHLLRVNEFEKENRMNLMNLAIVFGPCLLWREPTLATDLMTDVMLHNRVIEGLLTDFDRIYGGTQVPLSTR